MSNPKTNDAVDGAVTEAVRGAVGRAVNWTVGCDVDRAVDVYRAVRGAVWGAVFWAVSEDPEHPDLQDFLGEVNYKPPLKSQPNGTLVQVRELGCTLTL